MDDATEVRMAAIFNEWARRYAESPEEFGDILDDYGNAVTNYGINSARCFAKIASEMEEQGLI